MPAAPSLAELESRFKVVDTVVVVAGQRWELRRPESSEDLIREEDFDRDERLPYWAELWPSARVLADRVAAIPGKGRRLLELGCGVGLLSLTAAEAGFQVTATDYFTEALEFTAHNAERHGLSTVAARMIDWRQLPDDLGQFDMILASDVLYERPNAALVANVIRRSLKADGVALVSDPGRRPAHRFQEACASHGLAMRRVEAFHTTEGKVSLTVYVYEVVHDIELGRGIIAASTTKHSPATQRGGSACPTQCL